MAAASSTSPTTGASALNAKVREALRYHLDEAYMEIFPAPGIEDALGILDHNAYVAITCSPTHGVDATVSLAETLIKRGFRVTPHIAARSVRDRRHLADILDAVRQLGIESIFVPGGDARTPDGSFTNALELLQAIDEIGHDLKEIGVAAHPEGHPDADDETLVRALLDKQPLAHYLVTQMCFDAARFGAWLREIRNRGITLPVWIGLPGVIDRARLVKTSLRIGVGDSLRFLRRNVGAAAELMKHATYQPDDLVRELAPCLIDPNANIAGFHLFCFNEVAATEYWRKHSVAALAGIK